VVKAKADTDEAQKFKDYFDWTEPLRRCTSHRLLAMRRGETEGILRVHIESDDEQNTERLQRFFVRGRGACADLVAAAVADGYKRLLQPSIETEFAALSKEKADDDAIGAAAKTDEAKSNGGANGNPNVKVYINGGEIEAVSGGDTIDSNGDIFVTGGKLRLSSPADPYYEGVLLCNGTVHISGGDIAMVGNVGVELTVENQPVLFISHPSTQKAGSIVSLQDADGKTILSVTSQKDFKQTIFSSPQLEIGKTYTVFIDDIRKTEITLNDMIGKTADDGGTFTGGYPRGHW